MARTREFLKNLVSSRIDEVIPVGDVVQGQTAIETPLDAIEDELDFSAEFVTRVGDLEQLFPALVSDLKYFHDHNNITKSDGSKVAANTDVIKFIKTDLTTIIPLPEDFVRFVSLKLNSSKKEITELISSQDPQYRLQQNNPYTSGTRHKPVGALVSFTDYADSSNFKNNSNSAVNTNLLQRKYTIDANGNFTTNQTLSGLNNSFSGLATDDVIVLKGQTNPRENGTYLVNASGSPTKLSKNFNTITESGTVFATGQVNNMAIEFFKANATSDTIEKFAYIPRLLAEEIPDGLIDPLCYHCAGRVLESLQRPTEAQFMYTKANSYLTIFKEGLIGQE